MRNPSFAALEAALWLLTVADPGFKQLEGEEGEAEDREGPYREALIAALILWATHNRNLRVEDQLAVRSALNGLQEELEVLAAVWLRRGFRIGFGPGRMDAIDEQALMGGILLNSTFLGGSLIPYLTTELTQPGFATTPATTLAQIAENRIGAWQSRVGLYSGSYWTSIWDGVGANLSRHQAVETVPVRRLLDPGAKHCATCPPKAQEYTSWNEMLAFTGGLPADGSDACHSNCRCSIELFLEGEWVPVG